MAEYLEFFLFGKDGVERNVRMNKDDENEVYVWRECKTRPSYWWRCSNTIMKNGYYNIRIRHKHYALHRVCYYAHNPEWDIYNSSQDNSIDHIDQNKLNNHISNLRVATHSQNKENNNAKGYSYYKRDKRWVAHLMKDGKPHRKYCKTEEEAIAAREKLKATYHSF